MFAIAPLEGESLSHFLGRFRRENDLSASGLGKEAGIGAVVARWEKFYLNPFPSLRELEALAKVVQVDADRLRQMLPPPRSWDEARTNSPVWGVLCPVSLSQDHRGSLRRRIGAIATN